MSSERGVFGRARRIATIGGIDVRVDASWLLIAAIIVWTFWSRFDTEPGVGGGVALGLGVAGAVLFFGSVLAHELAHSLEATHRGVKVSGITLFLFGGVTESEFDVKRPRDELALTAIGPFTSLVLAAAFGLIATWAGAAGVGEVALVAGHLGWINLALGIFNLLPGAPLDGGRILRAIVWWFTDDRPKAIRIAGATGMALAGLLIGLGLLQLFAPGGFLGGIWFVFIGWFLFRAAGAEMTQGQLQAALSDVSARSLIDDTIPSIPADETVESAIEHWIRVREPDLFPVVEDGLLIGVIGIDDARDVPSDERATISVRDAATLIADLPTIEEDRPAAKVIDDLIAAERAVVATDDGEPIGVITRRRLMLVAQRSAQLRNGGRRRHRPPQARSRGEAGDDAADAGSGDTRPGDTGSGDTDDVGRPTGVTSSR